MSRRNDLGAFYRDVHRALSYSPPDTEVTFGLQTDGKEHWWTCACWAASHGAFSTIEEAQADYQRHVAADNDNKVHP